MKRIDVGFLPMVIFVSVLLFILLQGKISNNYLALSKGDPAGTKARIPVENATALHPINPKKTVDQLNYYRVGLQSKGIFQRRSLFIRLIH
ncbi:hypothetical protein [Peribacillus sp. NPDC097895]|uniref:hypothetical protein n=1 Tax=Peribacillus sp. NPDC097895 TaxID=3390619 RepID=UPI003CFED7BB